MSLIKSFRRLPSPVQALIKVVFVLAFWLLLWEGAATLLNKPLFLPKFSAVFDTFLRLLGKGVLLKIAGASLYRIFTAFLVGILLALVMSVLFYFVKPLAVLFEPLLTVIRATPVASFVMLLWLICENQNLSLPVVIGILMVLPLIYQNLSAGFRAIPTELMEVCRLYRFSPWKRIRVLYFPSLMPYFAPACVNALGLCWKSSVAAELLASTPWSLGKEISIAKGNLEIEELFAWTACVVILCLLLEAIMKLLFRKWRTGVVKIA